MNQQERDVIAGLFDRLKSAESQQRDPQVDAFIRERLTQQPGAVYALLQSMYVSEQALGDLSKQNEAMQGQVRDLQGQINHMEGEIHRLRQAPPPAQQSGGFLSGLFGSKPAEPPPRPINMGMAPPPPGFGQPQGGPPPGYGAPPQRGPWGAPQGGPPPGQYGAPMGGPQGAPWGQQAPPPQQGGMGGGGFLATAATAAVGVAGGMLAANAISSMMSGGRANASPAPSSGSTPAAGSTPGAGNQTSAEKSGEQSATPASEQSYDKAAPDQGNSQPASYDDGNNYNQGGYQQASYDDGNSYDDFSGGDDV
jgi:hypothetical protein